MPIHAVRIAFPSIHQLVVSRAILGEHKFPDFRHQRVLETEKIYGISIDLK